MTREAEDLKRRELLRRGEEDYRAGLDGWLAPADLTKPQERDAWLEGWENAQRKGTIRNDHPL